MLIKDVDFLESKFGIQQQQIGGFASKKCDFTSNECRDFKASEMLDSMMNNVDLTSKDIRV